MVSRVVIPVLDLEQNDDPISKVVVKGAKQLTTQTVVATSYSNDGATFSFQFSVLDFAVKPVNPLIVTHPIQFKCQRKDSSGLRLNPRMHTLWWKIRRSIFLWEGLSVILP